MHRKKQEPFRATLMLIIHEVERSLTNTKGVDVRN